MIQRAVEQRADDGYIVDSLGWAYYRIGNFEEAVKHLERAVELKPEDPTINDHLGDGYWKIGRVLEARFQWSHRERRHAAVRSDQEYSDDRRGKSAQSGKHHIVIGDARRVP